VSGGRQVEMKRLGVSAIVSRLEGVGGGEIFFVGQVFDPLS